MKRRIDAAKKSQMFRWLLKKLKSVDNRFTSAGISMEKAPLLIDGNSICGKKCLFIVPTLYARASLLRAVRTTPFRVAPFRFAVAEDTSHMQYGSCCSIVHFPCSSGSLSYSDVLDKILAMMKKTRGECYLRDSYLDYRLFLPKGTTLESLAIEFDLTWRSTLCQDGA